MDLMVALSTNNDRNADIASVERLANKLSLHSAEELSEETIAIRKLVKERRGLSPDSTEQIINLLNKFKRLAGVAENGILDDPDVPKSLTKCSSLAVPNEFFCPITLEIMTDPVIVATGQVYYVYAYNFTLLICSFSFSFFCRKGLVTSFVYFLGTL